MKPYKFSPDQLELHAVWLKAFQEGEFFIPCPEGANATKLRFALYNSVKPYRAGKADNPEMLEAIASVSVTVERGGVKLQHKSVTGIMQAVRNALGDTPIPEQQIMTQEERESLERLNQMLIEPSDGGQVKKNPYFTREDR